MGRRRKRDGAAGVVIGAPPPALRIEGIDALRGIALVAMIAYHFAFDLRWLGVTRSDFENDPWWIGARTLIVSAFLALVGVSLVLAARAGVSRERFLRRVALIGAAALAVSAVSHFAFPQTFIYFGILHCIAVASLIARPLALRPRTALAVGIAVVVAGLALSHPWFDTRATSWIGFTTTKPATQDFVPLFPWLGVVMAGIAIGHVLDRRGFRPLAPLARAPGWLRAFGRHSLVVYLVHQPLMLGVLWLALRAR